MVLAPCIDQGLTAPQTVVLPLHYASKLVPSVGFEPTLAMILSQRPLPVGLRGQVSCRVRYLPSKHRGSVTTLIIWCVLLESN